MSHCPEQNCFEQKGFVLIVVLMLMQLLFLLNACVIETVLLLTKMGERVMVHEDYYHEAGKTLFFEEELATSTLPPCLIDFIDPAVITEKPLDWWKMQGCSGNFQAVQYYYVVERSGMDSCAIFPSAQKTVAAWFRMTLFLYSPKEDARIFLQGTFIRPGVSDEPCIGRQHVVYAGRQSFRELD
ncbi:MAG TPA: hypothetical protein VLJ15_01250 [Gammaproteobacteria bacterium]|nr:hypothetical protein [Gammaproteobacteria bacterium]